LNKLTGAAIVAAFCLTACGGASGPSSGGPTVIEARVKDAIGLDPSHETDGLSLNMTAEIFDNLVRFKPGTFDVVPGIAQSWTAADGGTLWTFKLLRAPLGPFLRNLAMPSFGIGSPTAIAADQQAFALKPVGSGPYLVAEWVKDDHLTLTANPTFAGPAPAYATVIVRDIPDQSSAVLSMQKGDIDLLTDPRPDDAKSLATQSGITLYKQPSNNVMYLALNMDKKPFDNVLVRRAIAYAIDKAAIAKGFYSLGAQVADNWTPPGMLGENPAVKAYPHDVATAKKLLAQAGFPSGFATQIYYPTSPRPYMPEPQRVAETIQADLRQVGIAVTLQPYEFGVFLSKVRNGEHPMALIGWTGDNGDPDNFMYTLLDQDSAVKGEAQNYSFWRDPNFHKLMLAGQQETDEKKRAAIYERANALIHDQAPAVPIVHSVVSFAAKSNIAGIVPRPDSMLNFELMKPKASQ
jgi:peptide/nickel transport system substrate-binding protein